MIKVTPVGKLAVLEGNSAHFRLAAKAHCIGSAFQDDPHLAVSVSQGDPLPHTADGRSLAFVV